MINNKEYGIYYIMHQSMKYQVVTALFRMKALLSSILRTSI